MYRAFNDEWREAMLLETAHTIGAPMSNTLRLIPVQFVTDTQAMF